MVKENMKNLRVGVFIDGSNMLWSSIHSGINIDWQKMKTYLKNKYAPTVFNFYACEDNNPKPQYAAKALKQKKFYNKLEGMGYKMIRKELKHLVCGDTKCDMDIELIMDIRNYEDDIDVIILFTGDSDYLSAIQYYHSKGKYIRIFSFRESISWELKTFAITNPRCSYKLINELPDVQRPKLSTI